MTLNYVPKFNFRLEQSGIDRGTGEQHLPLDSGVRFRQLWSGKKKLPCVTSILRQDLISQSGLLHQPYRNNLLIQRSGKFPWVYNVGEDLRAAQLFVQQEWKNGGLKFGA